jgi:ubiquinone/menaquinone biosynthesis C-methylase UbiE
VQYLQQPEKVFAEVYRVLKPGGVAIFTFSNRMFYDKAISAWRDSSGYARCQLVKQCAEAGAFWLELTHLQLLLASSRAGGACAGTSPASRA